VEAAPAYGEERQLQAPAAIRPEVRACPRPRTRTQFLGEVSDGGVVRDLAPSDHPERHVLLASPFDLAGGADPCAVGVKQ